MTDIKDIPDVNVVVEYMKQLQIDICDGLQKFESDSYFVEDNWQYENGGGGVSRVIENGSVFEKGGVNFSHISGESLPEAASSDRQKIADKSFQATGVSVVMHPKNPFAPTCHMNVRFFIADPDSTEPVWWFGGGYDLTPYYGFVEDCKHWHKVAKSACDRFDPEYYGLFKKQCDDYFYLKHRKEARGIGGIFFDDLCSPGFSESFKFVQAVGNSFIEGYDPILEKRISHPYDENNRRYQCYRRGRYVEFNLIYDRGTIFGLQSEGRTESILMSLPPKVEWVYNRVPLADSEESRLVDFFLQRRDWINFDAHNSI